MPSVSEILQQAGLSTYEINSIDPKLSNAFGQVLTEAQLQKTSVDEFWRNTYTPGIQAWENERGEMSRRLARAEGEKAALLAERNTLAESGIVGADLPISTGQSRNNGGQYMSTPGTPSFTDPNDFVGRAAQGLAQIADVDYRHRLLFNQPMPITPSQLIKEADAKGIDPLSYAESRFGFSKKEGELKESRLRSEIESKIRQEFAEKTGSNPDMRQPSGSARYADTRRAVEKGELRDPTRMTQAERRTQALNSIHKAVEERQQRDA